ncbi:PspC domain-containing protein [Paenibacillus tarimensis]
MKKLYRSTRDKKVLGLCGGVAEMMNIDATLLRVLFIVAVIFSSGALILVYILAGLVVPKEPPMYNGFGGGYGQSSYGNGHGGHYNPGYGPTSGSGWNNWNNGPSQAEPSKQEPSNLDAMMDTIEKKAMRKEIEELKAKLAKYEKGDN